MTDFGDILDDLMGSTRPAPRPGKAEKPEKGVQMRGRTVDGITYVRVEDVAALLDLNGVLPKASALLRKGRA